MSNSLAKTRPLRDGIFIACLLFLVSAFMTMIVYTNATVSATNQMKKSMEMMARAAAAQVDVQAHARLRIPEQENSPEYRAAVLPLEKMLRSLPEFRFIYTTILQDGKVNFILDSAIQGDADGDGVDDHSYLMDPYDDADKKLLEALRTGKVYSSDRPYTDKWGTFISAYAPLLNPDGSVEGALGVDMRADDFQRQISKVHRVVLIGLLGQFLAALLTGALVFFFRKRAHNYEQRELETQAKLKKFQEQTLQSQKMETMGTLAGGIAHDLNNQLTPLIGYLDLMTADMKPGDPLRPFLDEANRAAKRSSDIVQRIVTFSKPSLRKKELRDLYPLSEELGLLLANVLPSTIKTQIRFPKDLWPVRCNETEVQSAIMNLCINSRDAMKQGGLLTVTAENTLLNENEVRAGFDPGRYVTIVTEDTGTGIAPDALPRIFEPFFSTKLKHEGTGLGLSMVFNIVKDHKGWMTVESTVGSGTRIGMVLPSAEGATSQSHDNTSEILKGNGQMVLVAEDEPALRGLAGELLTHLGYRSMFAEDGVQCVKIFERDHAIIDAVMLDMTMPRQTGRQTLEQLLKIDPSVRILVASGFTSEATWDELLRDGAAGYITKPYTLHSVGLGLRKILPSRPN